MRDGVERKTRRHKKMHACCAGLEIEKRIAKKAQRSGMYAPRSKPHQRSSTATAEWSLSSATAMVVVPTGAGWCFVVMMVLRSVSSMRQKRANHQGVPFLSFHEQGAHAQGELHHRRVALLRSHKERVAPPFFASFTDSLNRESACSASFSSLS